jgi:hypothetical protein
MTLNVFCFLATVFSGTAMVLTSFGVLLSFDPSRMVNGIYALVFSVLMCCIEVKTGVAKCCGCCRKVKDKVNFWAKFIGRLQGRGIMYVG